MFRAKLQKTFFFLFLSVLALLPFELPIAEGIHGTMKGLIGEAYPVMFVGSLLLFASLFMFAVSRFQLEKEQSRVTQKYCMISFLYIFIGIYSFIVTFALDGNKDISLTQLIFGYFTPTITCLYILCLSEKKRQMAWFALYFGWVLFLLGSLYFLRSSWYSAFGEHSLFADATSAQKIYVWRYTFEHNWNNYATYMGNANKMSNYIVIFLMMSQRLLGRDIINSSRSTKIVFWLFWGLGVYTLIILFSRAALLLLPFIFIISGVWDLMSKRGKYIFCALVILYIPFAYSNYSDTFKYLFMAKFLNEDNTQAIGTLASRLGQLQDIGNMISGREGILFWGLGTGGYGVTIGNSVDLGSHNMFLDTLLESGILSLFLLIVLILVMLVMATDIYRLKMRDKNSFGIIIVLIFLMFREHSISYLYVTSLGGFCFTVIFYLLCVSNVSEKISGAVNVAEKNQKQILKEDLLRETRLGKVS